MCCQEEVEAFLCYIIKIATIAMPVIIVIYFVIFNDSNDQYSPVEFNITEASITQFNLTNNTLDYNFQVNITARNSGNKMKFYQKINAISSYKGNEFAWAPMPTIILGKENTVVLGPIVFKGNKVIKLEPQQLVEYDNEMQLGVYNLDFELYPIVHCSNLRIPLTINGVAPTFNITTCSPHM